MESRRVFFVAHVWIIYLHYIGEKWRSIQGEMAAGKYSLHGSYGICLGDGFKYLFQCSPRKNWGSLQENSQEVRPSRRAFFFSAGLVRGSRVWGVFFFKWFLLLGELQRNTLPSFSGGLYATYHLLGEPETTIDDFWQKQQRKNTLVK